MALAAPDPAGCIAKGIQVLDITMNTISMDRLPIGWFDLIVVAVLVTGALRGRKHGMSEQLMPLLRWVSAVVLAALLYKPLGILIERETLLSKLAAYITAYLGCLLLVFIGFSIIKRLSGGKPISAEKFGKSEYYLGVCAGMVTVTCILMVALSFLNARKFTSSEIQARQAYEKDVYGSSFFPSLDSMQSFVFQKSMSGAAVKQYAAMLMIEPTLAQKKGIERKEWNMP
jgi:uncharacterized membrane protein required for colicin V production